MHIYLCVGFIHFKEKPLKLFDLRRNTYIRVQGNGDEILKFCHLDGMYSVCKDAEGNIIHLAAWTDVDVVQEAAESAL